MTPPDLLPAAARCPKCHAREFSLAEAETAPGLRGLRCVSCGEEFAVCDGVPYLGGFDHHDAAFLVESLASRKANRGAYQSVKASSAPAFRAHSYFDAIEAVWLGKAADESSVGLPAADLSARTTELLSSKALMDGIDFNGRSLLDVGAGSGTDAFLFHRAGAQVIAMEPNLSAVGAGSTIYPELIWMGGSADAIPLDDSSVDIVTANASLHHHVDVCTSLDEMLRVLKRGGWMLTSGDTFKGSSSEPVEVDWQQFDTHTGVLHGINEQIVRLDAILERIRSYSGALEGQVHIREGRNQAWRVFTLEEAQAEVTARPRMWGIMALRLRKVKNFTPKANVMRRGPMSVLELAAAVRQSAAAAYTALARLLPASDIRSRLPLEPSEDASRLLQLNGWRWPRAGAGARFAYQRGRLFLRRLPESRFVTMEFTVPPIGGAPEAEIACEVDGVELRRATVPRGVWHTWSLELPANSIHESCCFELQMTTDGSRTAVLDPKRHIEVRSVALSSTKVQESCRLADHTTLAALLRRSSATQTTLVAGSQVETVLSVIGQILRQGTVDVILVASDDIWPFYSWHPCVSRRTAPLAEEGLVLWAGLTDMDRAPEGSANTWLVQGNGVAVHFGAAAWPDPQLTIATAFDDERRQLTARLAKAEAKLAEAKQRADKFKEKYEATRKRKPNWFGRMVGR